jgi:hypothetical protein
MHINKIKFMSISVITLGLVTTANAVSTGWYAGGQLGATNTHNQTRTVYTTSGTPPTLSVKPSNTGMGERVFGGYNFNPYAAFEFGYTHYGASTYSVPASAGICNDPAIRTSGFDMEGKGILPAFDSGFALFGKAGFSLMRVSMSGSLSPNNSMVTGCSSSGGNNGGTTMSARPLVGIGTSYDLSQNWVTELSWTHVLSGGGVKAADFVAIGIAYHWVDKYCGQFLC